MSFSDAHGSCFAIIAMTYCVLLLKSAFLLHQGPDGRPFMRRVLLYRFAARRTPGLLLKCERQDKGHYSGSSKADLPHTSCSSVNCTDWKGNNSTLLLLQDSVAPGELLAHCIGDGELFALHPKEPQMVWEPQHASSALPLMRAWQLSISKQDGVQMVPAVRTDGAYSRDPRAVPSLTVEAGE